MVDIWELRWFWELWSKQDGKCSICGDVMEVNETTAYDEKTCSLVHKDCLNEDV